MMWINVKKCVGNCQLMANYLLCKQGVPGIKSKRINTMSYFVPVGFIDENGTRRN